MSDGPATNEAHAIVESARLGRRSEEAGRVFAQVSFPIDGNERLLTLLARNLKNPVQITLTEVQQALWEEEEPDAEMTNLIVDGEEAPVKRPRGRPRAQSNGSTPEADKPLVHVAQLEGGVCKVCQGYIDNEAHVATQAEADLINESRRMPATAEEAEAQAQAEASLAGRSK